MKLISVFLLTALLCGCKGMPLYRSVDELKAEAEYRETVTTERDFDLVYRDIGRQARSISEETNRMYVGSLAISMREVSELDRAGGKGVITMLQGYTTRIAHYEITRLPTGGTEVKAWWSRFGRISAPALKAAIQGQAP